MISTLSQFDMTTGISDASILTIIMPIILILIIFLSIKIIFKGLQDKRTFKSFLEGTNVFLPAFQIMFILFVLVRFLLAT